MRRPRASFRTSRPTCSTRLRARAPRVHCITNAVAQTFTANVLLAAGAIPSMTLRADEIGAFVARADALLVNLGTFDAERRDAAATALEVASEEGVPWVLDPVFIDRSAAARRLCQVAGRRRSRARSGSTAPNSPRSSGTEPERRCAGALCARHARGHRAHRHGRPRHRRRAARRSIANGHPLMARVTAMGCAASALVGPPSSRSRAIAFAGDRGGAALLRRRGRDRGRARERAGQFRYGDSRRAACARPRHADAREGAI